MTTPYPCHAAALLALAALLPACATTTRTQTGVPEDFWLSATVMSSPQHAHASDRAHRPARYLIEGDRALRAAVGPGASEYAMPPLLRPLSDEQVARICAELRGSGLAAPDHPAAVSVAPTLEQLGDRTLIVISYKLDKSRRTLVLDPAQSPDDSAKAFELVDQLAELAWIRPEGQ